MKCALFEQLVANDGIRKLKEKVVVFSKVQSTPNQVFVLKGLDKSITNDLTSILKTDNDSSCETHVCYEPIDNSEDTIGLSEKTSWRVKHRYILETLNLIFVEQSLVENFEVQDVNFISKKNYAMNDWKGKSKIKTQFDHNNKERKRKD